MSGTEKSEESVCPSLPPSPLPPSVPPSLPPFLPPSIPIKRHYETSSRPSPHCPKAGDIVVQQRLRDKSSKRFKPQGLVDDEHERPPHGARYVFGCKLL